MDERGPSRFEELLRELRAEHERLLRRLGAEAPRSAKTVAWGAPGRASAESAVDAVELPGVPVLSPRDELRAAGRHPGGPSPSRVTRPAPEKAEVIRSELSEISISGIDQQASSFSIGRSRSDAVVVTDESRKSPGMSSKISKFSAWWKSMVDRSESRSTLWRRYSSSSELEERSRLEKIVTSTTFELIMAAVILLNALCIAVEAQYNGMESGYKVGLQAKPVWPGADSVFLVLEWLFGILFTVELALKLVAIPRRTLTDSWTVIDVLVVAFFWVERLSSDDAPFPPTLIRLARMVRIMRFLRVVKTIRGFASLYLMLQSIKGSVSALGWSSVVLLVIEMMFALTLNLLLVDFWEDQRNEYSRSTPEQRERLYEYFGTFSRSLLTMIEMLLGNWFVVTRILIDFNELFMIFGICHQLVFGFAVIEVISGVFLNETFKVAALDDSIMLNEVRRAAKAESAKLTEFFNKADKDGSGLVDESELKKVLDNKQVEEWLNAMGLDMSDIAKAFRMLDKDGDGYLTPAELVEGASKMKKPARAVDLAAVQAMLEDVSTHVGAITR